MPRRSKTDQTKATPLVLLSVLGRQLAALASSEPALLETLLPSVQRRSLFAQIRKIFRKPDQLEIQVRITILRERDNAHPHNPPGLEPRRIEIKLADK